MKDKPLKIIQAIGIILVLYLIALGGLSVLSFLLLSADIFLLIWIILEMYDLREEKGNC